MKRILLILLIGSSSALWSTLRAQSNGQTQSVEEALVEPPVLSFISDDSLNGEPLFGSALIVLGKFNGTYDLTGGLSDYNTFYVSAIDVYGDEDYKQFGMDLVQSQMRFRTFRQTKHGEFNGYFEADFWNEDLFFRVRHLWFDFYNFHVGQDWSTFADKAIWPNVFDWDGPPSGIWRRQPMIKFYKKNADWKYEAAIESAQMPGTIAEDPSAMYQAIPQPVPDLILAARRNLANGHVRASGVLRNFYYENDGGVDNTLGYGVALSGLHLVGEKKRNMIQWQWFGGYGIATYSVAYLGGLQDTYYNMAGHLETTLSHGGWLSYEHWFNERWHSNAVWGYSRLEADDFFYWAADGGELVARDSDISNAIQYVLVNLMYTPQPSFTIGLEYNYGGRTEGYAGTVVYDGILNQEIYTSRSASRISFGAFFQF